MTFRNAVRMMSLPALGIHLALILIVAGALVTWFSAERGTLRLTEGAEPVSSFVLEDNSGNAELPFHIGLEGVTVSCYPGTDSPMDYSSALKVLRDGVTEKYTVSMNNIAEIDYYRLYQTGMGEDSTVLTVYHDPWGIGITYGGYFLLFVSIFCFFFARRSRFRTLLKALASAAVFVFAVPAQAAGNDGPAVLQRPLARTFGELYCYWGGRVAPVQTMARDFCLKVHGSDSFRGLTPEQVVTGWIFYYDSWKNVPYIRVKGNEIRKVLGIDGGYASLSDFYDRKGYKLQPMLDADPSDRNLREVDERVNLVTTGCTGNMFRIFPVVFKDGSVVWQSWVDPLPRGLSGDKCEWISSGMESVAREIAHGRFNAANTLLREMRGRQIEEVSGDALPSAFRYSCERVYNALPSLWMLAGLALAVGALRFILFCRRISRPSGIPQPEVDKVTARILFWTGWLIWLYLTLIIALLWIIGAHIPLSNGEETMLAIGWTAVLVSDLPLRRMAVLSPMGMLAGALALVVAGIGSSNPAVSNLVPVLVSPLLSVHVMLVMFSYALFAVITLTSIAALFLDRVPRHKATASRLTVVSDVVLYPALFLLGAGIFTGAIWANVSWGRYWGWDPKETWALITFLVYAVPVHARSLKVFREVRFTNAYYIFSFLFVLFTYFGVNYFLPGLHSYA